MLLLQAQGGDLGTEIYTLIGVILAYLLKRLISDFKNIKLKKIEKKETDIARADLTNRLDKMGENVKLLLEMHKSDADIKQLEFRLNSIPESDILPIELNLAINNGINEARKLFAYIFLNNFTLSTKTIYKRFELSKKKISRLCDCERIDIDDYEDFKNELKSKIDMLFSSYLIDLEQVFKKENGKRRADFARVSFNLVKDISLFTEMIYKKYV